MAIFLSGLCLLHCLAVPFALLLGPLIGNWLTATETQMHWFLLLLAVPLSGFALWRGYQRHANGLTLGLGGAGLVIMFVGVSHWFGEVHEIWLTVLGVSMVLVAHLRNTLGTHRHNI